MTVSDVLKKYYKNPAECFDEIDVYNISGRSSFGLSVCGLYNGYGDYLVRIFLPQFKIVEPYIEIYDPSFDISKYLGVLAKCTR